MTNSSPRHWLATLLLGSILAFQASVSLALIESTESQAETAIDLVNKLEQRHYSKRKFDDDLSSQLFDAYFRGLDPSHLFLYKSDIEEFEHYRFKLDEHLSEGNLDAGFEIFNRYQERIESRLAKLLSELPDMVAEMDSVHSTVLAS